MELNSNTSQEETESRELRNSDKERPILIIRSVKLHVLREEEFFALGEGTFLSEIEYANIVGQWNESPCTQVHVHATATVPIRSDKLSNLGVYVRSCIGGRAKGCEIRVKFERVKGKNARFPGETIKNIDFVARR